MRLIVFVGFLMLLVPGLLAARAGDASKIPQGITPPRYQPITKSRRARWFVTSVVGPESLAAGVVSAGWGTAFNSPPEHGPHISGFAQRYGMGTAAPAYARYAGIAGENFIAKVWRPDSESSVNFALGQCALGFVGRFAGNLFDEFWRDVRNKVRRPGAT